MQGFNHLLDNKIDEIPGALTSSGTSSGRIPWDWTYKGRTLESLGDNRMQPAYDMFTVESEGVSGTFRAFPRQTHQMFKLTSNAATAEDKMVDTYNPILNLDDKHWPSKEDFVYKEGSQRENSDYKYYNVNNTPFARYKTQFRNEGNRMVRRINDDLDNPLYSGISFLFLGEGGYYESEKMDDEIKIEEGEKKLTDYEPGKVSDILLKRTLNGKEYALYGSRKVEPIFEDDSPVSKIKGFVITNSDGSKYFFTKPVKSYLKIDYSINQEKGTPVFVDRKMSKDEGFWKHLGDGLATLFWPPKTLESIRQAVMGHLDETCQPNPSDETMLYSYQVNMNPYATQWLLEEIQGPDYIQLDKAGNDMSKNIGYNVRFEYTDPSLYQWRSPYAQPDIASKDLPNFRMPRNGLTPVGCDTKMFQASFGVKEYRYLKSIETATHKVVFDLNNPETEERVDGKGWYFNRINGDNKNTLPILTTAAIALRIKSVNSEYIDKIWIDKIPFGEKLEDPKPLENWHDAQYEYDALYVNVEIPELLLADLKKNPKLNLESDFYKKMVYLGDDQENAIVFKDYDNEFTVEVDKDADHWYEKTAGDETKYGLYKIKLKKGDDKHLYWYASNKGQKLHNSALQGKVKLFLGEMGAAVVTGTSDKYALTQCSLKEGYYYVHNVQSSYYPLCNDNNDLTPSILDWSDIVFVDNQNDESMNQMRYLKKISYYKKDKNGAFDNKNPYREYNFEYDYSLHPKTLNSYCKSRYPKELADIQNSPLQANLDICSKTDNTVRNLYGKLTLKSIYEKGCQNGRCASLPPFKFDYNAASQTSTRYSSKDAWAELSKKNTPKWETAKPSSSGSTANSSSGREQFFSEDYYGDITDVDASIIASNNTTDEWGFWNTYANEDNHKVTQSFANYGGAAWSLNKVTDPAGGVMEVKYERDVYKNGEDHSDEHLYVRMYRFEKCSELIGGIREYVDENSNSFPTYNTKYDDKMCAAFKPLYWKDQCLGPRTAFWDETKPKGYKGGDFDYMNELGLVKNGQFQTDVTVFFNAHSEVSTTVGCGFWETSDCDRYRDVGLLGSTKFEAMYEDEIQVPKMQEKGNVYQAKPVSTKMRILVLEKDHKMIYAGFQLATDKINGDLPWKLMSVDGTIWAKREYSSMKGGDIRVKSLIRHDIDRVAKTEYEYEPGEMAQLPDSAYTTVMGNRFNANLISFAMPDLNMKPRSRIVGFEDDDLLYVPGSSIMYPKVTVKNSDAQGTVTNGKTEFEYITPEKGIPEEYIDPRTKDSLKSFIHVNSNVIVWGGDKNDGDYKVRPLVVTFTFYHVNKQNVEIQIGNPMNILLMQGRNVSFNFYDDEVEYVNKIKLSYKKKSSDIPDDIGEINDLRMNKFNEVSITVAHILNEWHVYKNWERSQEKGYYPIMYKKIIYDNNEKIYLKDAKEAKDFLEEQEVNPDFEKKIIYHDFTAFLGMNTKTSIYRGNDDKAILLKVDSTVYSTSVPDVLEGIAEGTDVDYKVGKQVERWRSSRELQCYNNNEDCKRSDVSLSSHNKKDIKDDKERTMVYFEEGISFEYRRYPAFQIASITSNGFDNQEKQFDASSSSIMGSSSSSFAISSSSCDERCVRNKKRMHTTVIENHRYDPVTSNPTATVAKIPSTDDGELRKLTVKLPHHAVLNQQGEATNLSKRMFKKNMLAQNYAEFIYFDSKSVKYNIPWNNLDKLEYLKSFSIKPLNKYKGTLQYLEKDKNGGTKLVPVESEMYPYAEWGSFSSKKEPAEIINSNINSTPYIFVASYHDRQFESSANNWPDKQEFSGNRILQVDKYLRPVETENEMKRIFSSHYTEDGLYQIGLFFPAALNKTMTVVPYGNEISVVNVNRSIIENLNVDLNQGGMIAQSSVSLSCFDFVCDTNMIAEYRVLKVGKKWQTVRENLKDFHLNLNSGDILNYLRIYPEEAEAKTFIYDNYGNMIQSVAEDNTSTFYEYDSFGKLIQTRNDDGVSFKSHHREFTNDDRNEIPWSESVISSSSSTSSSSSGN